MILCRHDKCCHDDCFVDFHVYPHACSSSYLDCCAKSAEGRICLAYLVIDVENSRERERERERGGGVRVGGRERVSCLRIEIFLKNLKLNIGFAISKYF